MCVIFIVNKNVRPTEDMVAQAFEANKSGAGASWREGGFVYWKKGMTEEEVQSLNKTLPFPYVLHFRVPSPGTSTLPSLCHPFPIQPNVPLALEGRTKGSVLFHNGFWGQWKAKIEDGAWRGGYKIPSGQWSDTRGLAWAAAHVGTGILEFIDEKVVVFGLNSIENFGHGWSLENDVWVSNVGWKRHTSYYSNVPGHMGPHHHRHETTTELTARLARETRERAVGGTSHEPTFCGSDDRSAEGASGEADKSKPVQEAVGKVETPIRATLEDFEWACAQNPKQYKALPPATFTGQCDICKKQDAIYFGVGFKHCWGCHDKAGDEQRAAATPKVIDVPVKVNVVAALCNFCRENRATHRTISSREWMCHQCWLHKSRPDLVRASQSRELTDAEVQAAKYRQAREQAPQLVH